MLLLLLLRQRDHHSCVRSTPDFCCVMRDTAVGGGGDRCCAPLERRGWLFGVTVRRGMHHVRQALQRRNIGSCCGRKEGCSGGVGRAEGCTGVKAIRRGGQGFRELGCALAVHVQGLEEGIVLLRVVLCAPSLARRQHHGKIEGVLLRQGGEVIGDGHCKQRMQPGWHSRVERVANCCGGCCGDGGRRRQQRRTGGLSTPSGGTRRIKEGPRSRGCIQ